MKVVLAFSGGLDTTYCAVWLQEQGHEVHTVTVNTGGFSNEELARIEKVAADARVASHITVDARQNLFDRYLRYLLYGNVLRGQMYPLSVSAERVCQAVHIIEAAKQIGGEAVAHGSTGAGNDQVRFDVAFRALAPNLQILTPIRDQSLSRQEETDYLSAHGVHIPPKTTTYSINEGMWGSSIGGRETLTSEQPVPFFPSGDPEPNRPAEKRTLRFEKGVPVAPLDTIYELNEIGSKFGIGRGHHVGDTILGIKGRIGFEAPAAHLLIAAHRELEKVILTGKQLFWKETLGNLYGSLLHEGQFFDPLARDLEAFLESTQAFVTGEVYLELYPRGFTVEGVRSEYSLMNPDLAAYGEGSKLWTADEARGFCKIYGLPSSLVARAQGEFQ